MIQSSSNWSPSIGQRHGLRQVPPPQSESSSCWTNQLSINQINNVVDLLPSSTLLLLEVMSSAWSYCILFPTALHHIYVPKPSFNIKGIVCHCIYIYAYLLFSFAKSNMKDLVSLVSHKPGARRCLAWLNSSLEIVSYSLQRICAKEVANCFLVFSLCAKLTGCLQ